MTDINYDNNTKLLANGEWVPVETRTRNAAGGRVLLTQDEIDKMAVEKTADNEQRSTNMIERVYEQRLNGGITINGMTVKTHAESRGLINGAVTRAMIENDPDQTHDFYAPDGSVIPLTNAQFVAIGLALANHVNKCLQVRNAIRGTTFEDFAAVETAFDAAYNA